jgi:hypothetical protein
MLQQAVLTRCVAAACAAPTAVTVLCSIWVQFVPYFLVGVSEVFTK